MCEKNLFAAVPKKGPGTQERVEGYETSRSKAVVHQGKGRIR